MPKFSVIIPVYKVEEYLDRCIESVLAQIYADYEIILVDDGSPDNCPAMCDEWATKDSRICVIHKENGGLSSARNAGLNVAKGDLIYFLDSDDYIEPNLLEDASVRMVGDVDLWGFGFYKHECNQITPIHFCGSHTYFHNDSACEKSNFICKEFLNWSIGWEAWHFIFKRKIIESHNLRFADNNIIFAEDMYFGLVYLAHVSHISISSKAYYHYMIRDTSIMGVQKQKNNFGRFCSLCEAVFANYTSQAKELCEHFPAILMQIIRHAIKSYKVWHNLPLETMECFRSSPERYCFFSEHFKLLLKSKSMQETASCTKEDLNLIRYWAHGNYSLLRIRNKILYHTKLSKPNKKKNSRHIKGKHIYVLGIENSGNVGDALINAVTLRFINKSIPTSKVLEVDKYGIFNHKANLSSVINNSDLIVLPGGGNMGDVYPEMESSRQSVITAWPNNIIVSFPQTIDFHHSNTLAHACEVYGSHNKLTVLSREIGSYEFAKKHFKCDNILCPDIVLSLDKTRSYNKQDVVQFCLRDDAEQAISTADIMCMQNAINETGFTFNMTDTHILENITSGNRDIVIENVLERIGSSRLVITDRLHGMIICAITGTPCVVLSNNNHKVKGTYDWISYLPYIKYAETIDEAIGYIPELLKMENCVYDNTPLQPYFDELRKAIREL